MAPFDAAASRSGRMRAAGCHRYSFVSVVPSLPRPRPRWTLVPAVCAAAAQPFDRDRYETKFRWQLLLQAVMGVIRQLHGRCQHHAAESCRGRQLPSGDIQTKPSVCFKEESSSQLARRGRRITVLVHDSLLSCTAVHGPAPSKVCANQYTNAPAVFLKQADVFTPRPE